MYQDGVWLWPGSSPLILGLQGLVLRDGQVLILEEESGGGGLGFWLLQLPHPLVPFLPQGSLLLGPVLSRKAPSDVPAALSYPTGPTLAKSVRIMGEP